MFLGKYQKHWLYNSTNGFETYLYIDFEYGGRVYAIFNIQDETINIINNMSEADIKKHFDVEHYNHIIVINNDKFEFFFTY